MINLSLSEIQEYLSQVKSDKLPKLNFSILRNIMVEPIETYLNYLSHQIGHCAKIKFGEYDNIFQVAIGGNKELLNNNTDCVLLYTQIETLSWDLARNYTVLKREDINSEVERIKDLIINLLSGIRSQTNAMILWHSFELPVFPALGIFDLRSESGQYSTINNLNEFLRKNLNKFTNAYLIDLNLLIARLGYHNFYDFRYWHIGRAPYSRIALRENASEIFKYVRPLKGKNKKCLVLDCDNVLWGGIIGEDGLSGIQLGKNYPGSCYYEFQQEVVNLYHRGIILGICSKNNEYDVLEVFNKHPCMLLKEEHIATYQINWEDKPTNLKRIALDLNIGLDSMVFIDDNEFEVDLVRRTLPEVEVIHVPKNRAVEFRVILAACGWFDTLIISDEDKKRGALYKTEINRKQLQSQSIDMLTYYKSLEMRLDICYADDFSIPRIAQLTQKTNQFNLTTKRYSEANIKSLMLDPSSDVIYLRLKDKFGDSGIVGVCILNYFNKGVNIDTFLLSCRVLGRGVEDAFLSKVLGFAKQRKCKVVIGEYIATHKNIQVSDFYEKQRFKITDLNKISHSKLFHYNLKDNFINEPDYFTEINSKLDKMEGVNHV